MKHFFTLNVLVIALLVPALNGCDLRSAPMIGGMFPTNTPTFTPTFTPTQSATATATATATETPSQTPSPLPSNTATITPTPGPFSYVEDFSQAGSLGHFSCTKCKVEDGRLLFGPFDPENNLGEQFRIVLCETCGAHIYYRLGVDVTYATGPTDRFYGITALIDTTPTTLNRVLYLGASTWQVYTIRDYNYKKSTLTELNGDLTGYLNPGTMTNHLEIEVKPSAQPNLVDVYFRINDGVMYVLFSQPAVPTRAGLGMSFHSMTVAYDNFTYEETEVK